MMYFSILLSNTFVLCAIIDLVSTAPDHPLITAKPRAPTAAQLEYRQDDTGPNTYGYIEGDANSPLACGAGHQFTTDGQFGLCCNDVDCENVFATCVDKSGGLDICSGAYSSMCALSSVSVLHCKSPEPSCFRYMRITDAQDTNPAYIHRCGTASGDINVFVSPTNEAAVQTKDSSQTTVDTSFARSTLGATRTQGPASGSKSGSNVASGGIGTETASPGAPSGPSGSIWKYAVVGVGVLILILTLLGVIFFLWRRSQRIRPALPSGGGLVNNSVDYQHMDTVAGSVVGEMRPERRAFVGRWTESHAGGAPEPMSEAETLVSKHSRRG